MDIELFNWGQFLTLMMIALALGMDAFSLSVGIGMSGIRLRDVARVSLTIGLFHIGMPLLGIFIGTYLSDLVGDIAVVIGGAVLMVIGIHMVWNAFQSNEQTIKHTHTLGLFLFAFSVSVDALTVGFSFGLLAVNHLLAVTLFGLTGTILTAVGLLLGRRIGDWLGEYSEVLAGIILFAFGLKFLF